MTTQNHNSKQNQKWYCNCGNFLFNGINKQNKRLVLCYSCR